MDVTSYLLGKQQGGGGTPNLQNKDITITENGETNVSADAGYDGLSNVGITTNVQPDLETKSVTITENTTTTITPSQGKDGLSSVEVITNVSGATTLYPYSISFRGDTSNFNLDNVDFSNYSSSRIDDMFRGCQNIKEIHFNNFNTVLSSAKYTFYNCKNLETCNFDAINLGGVEYISQLDTMFGNTSKLTDDSLDRLLVMCINCGTTGSLWNIGLGYYNVARIQALPHYQEFINAGWTIGY